MNTGMTVRLFTTWGTIVLGVGADYRAALADAFAQLRATNA